MFLQLFFDVANSRRLYRHVLALEVQGTIMRYYQLRFLYLHVSLDVAIEYVGNVYNIICISIVTSIIQKM